MNQNTFEGFMYQPMVYSNQTSGEMIQPVSVEVPPGALQRAAQLNGTSNSNVRVVNILHRTSVLFPTTEDTRWVSAVINVFTHQCSK